MAAISEVIRGQNLEFSATVYFAMLQDMISSGKGNMEVLTYCYSAMISQVDFGVISHQESRILNICEQVMTKCSPTAIKYCLICLQFVLHSKTENQWNNDPLT